MPQTATIKSLPEAFEVVKAMQTDGLDWGEGYRPRRALAEIIEGRMAEDVDRWLGNLDGAAACVSGSPNSAQLFQDTIRSQHTQ